MEVTTRGGAEGWWGARMTGGSGTGPRSASSGQALRRIGMGARGGSRRFFEAAQHEPVGASSGRGRFETGPLRQAQGRLYARGDARRAEDGRVGDPPLRRIRMGAAGWFVTVPSAGSGRALDGLRTGSPRTGRPGGLVGPGTPHRRPWAASAAPLGEGEAGRLRLGCWVGWFDTALRGLRAGSPRAGRALVVGCAEDGRVRDPPLRQIGMTPRLIQ